MSPRSDRRKPRFTGAMLRRRFDRALRSCSMRFRSLRSLRSLPRASSLSIHPRSLIAFLSLSIHPRSLIASLSLSSAPALVPLPVAFDRRTLVSLSRARSVRRPMIEQEGKKTGRREGLRVTPELDPCRRSQNASRFARKVRPRSRPADRDPHGAHVRADRGARRRRTPKHRASRIAPRHRASRVRPGWAPSASRRWRRPWWGRSSCGEGDGPSSVMLAVQPIEPKRRVQLSPPTPERVSSAHRVATSGNAQPHARRGLLGRATGRASRSGG